MKVKWYHFLFVFFVIILISIIAYTLQINKNKVLLENQNVKERLINIVKNQNDGMSFDMSEITEFNWEMMYIVSPYKNLKDFREKYDIEWTKKINTTIEHNDSINLLVFTNNKKIVAYVNYPRKNGDFLLSSEEIKKDQAVYVIKTKSNDIYFEPLVN